ncbi:MAG: hypothetical protein IJX77_05030 [Ruminococcus sp.]|nr:hypothetical protein [Ruminococcus sp.]
MTNNKRKLIALSIITALTLSAFAGCNDSDKEKKSNSSSDATTIADEDMIKQPIQFYYPTDSLEENATESPLVADDPTEPAGNSSSNNEDSSTGGDSAEPVTEYIEVTEADGQPATQYVEVTEAGGQVVTEADGQTVTQSVPVTTVVTVENSGGNSDETSNNSSDNNSGDSSADNSGEYTPYMDGSWAMWLDISEDKDFIFQDEFIEVTFKIKESAPDGVYDVNITNPDFANLVEGGTTLVPDTVINGKVYVSEELVPQREITDADGFTVYGEHVAAKQGDEVTFTFNMKNNPGMVAMMFEFEYDRNAMDIVNCQAVGDFGEISNPEFAETE